MFDTGTRTVRINFDGKNFNQCGCRCCEFGCTFFCCNVGFPGATDLLFEIFVRISFEEGTFTGGLGRKAISDGDRPLRIGSE